MVKTASSLLIAERISPHLFKAVGLTDWHFPSVESVKPGFWLSWLMCCWCGRQERHFNMCFIREGERVQKIFSFQILKLGSIEFAWRNGTNNRPIITNPARLVHPGRFNHVYNMFWENTYCLNPGVGGRPGRMTAQAITMVDQRAQTLLFKECCLT